MARRGLAGISGCACIHGELCGIQGVLTREQIAIYASILAVECRRWETARRRISVGLQERRRVRPHLGVGRDLVVEHLIGDFTRVNLGTLLLQPIGGLGLQLDDEIWVLLQDTDDLVG